MEKLKIFTNNIDHNAQTQIENFMAQECMKDNIFRIMPDVHSTKGSVIGLTIKLNNKKVIPSLIGSDIGCGVDVYKFTNKIELEKFDKYIHGKHIMQEVDFIVGKEAFMKGYIGSLGGGNHFIEIDKDDNGNYYLIIHSGSRHIGELLNNYWQKLAYEKCNKELPYLLSYIEDDDFDDYCFNVKVAVDIARKNRALIAKNIIHIMKLKVVDSFSSVHNYIDDDMILRKGAVKATDNRLIIPINMRDGCLICRGRSNEDWNYSAPHGAGRLIKRSEVKNITTLNQLKKDMKGIYTTSLSKETLDESPVAYKPINEIIENIGDTVEIIEHIKPIYNFKCSF